MKPKTHLTMFAHRLRRAREEAGLSRQSLEDAAHLSHGCIVKHLEDGRRGCNLLTAISLAKALHVSLDWLCGFDLDE